MFGHSANGYAADDAYASVAPAKNTTRAQRYAGFGFGAIPAGAVIERVTISVEWAVSSGSAQATLAAQAVAGGTLVGTPLTNTAKPTTDTVQSFEVTGLTRADLASGFEVEVRASRGGGGASFTARLDAVQVAVDYIAGSMAYTYDANGNQLSAGADTFSWDAADRLLSASVGGSTQTYAYAGDGRRLSVTAGGASTSWLWDLNHPLPQLALERDGSGQTLRRSTYGLGRIATITGGIPAYHHADGLGSLVDLTDPAGDALAWSEYQPFGAVRSSGLASGAPSLPFGFTGEYADPTGLVHLRARQYDPTSGRFLSTDPVAPLLSDPYVGSYVYVRNMPTVAVDPSGRFLNIVGGFVAGTLAYAAGTVIGNALQGNDLTLGLNAGDAFMAGATGALMAGTAGMGLLVQTSVGGSLGAITTAASMGINGRRGPTELAWGALFGIAGPLADVVPIPFLNRMTGVGLGRGFLTSTFLSAGQNIVTMERIELASLRLTTGSK